MGAHKGFSKTALAALDASKILGVRAGRTHRFIGIWMVVVRGRLFVRSWTRKPDGWYHAFLQDPRGAIEVAGRVIRVRAVFPRSERVKTEVDAAYRAKYFTPGALKYVRGFKIPSRRHTTTEFVPQ